jgi:hypothetical protein
MDGDSVQDLAVGAYLEDDGGIDRGAVYVLFLNSNGTVKLHQKISDTEGNFYGVLNDEDAFGTSVASLGDIDGDGVVDLAVGAPGPGIGAGAGYAGAVWILFMNDDGTVKSYQKIDGGSFAGPLAGGDNFGYAISPLGDLDSDGVVDVAVGARLDDDGGAGPEADRGAVWVLFLKADGTVKSHQKISDTEGNFTGILEDIDLFGTSVASPGDYDGDGVVELVVGARADDGDAQPGDFNQGAVWVLFLEGEPDGDGDGVPDVADLCPTEDASYFDRDGDGCIDRLIGARHTSYWDAGDLPFEYFIHEDGAFGIGDGSEFTAVQNGIGAWTALAGVDFSVSYLGTTPQAVASAMDGLNLVTFSDSEYVFVPQDVIAVGLTTTFTAPTSFQGRLIRPGQIVDADIIYNERRTFSTSTAGSGKDIESIAAHEAGHLFGFWHSAKKTSTMFYILPPGEEGASLSPEDATMFFKGYPDSAAALGANILTGTVVDSLTGEPVPGAIVFAIDAGSGDTLGCAYTLPREAHSRARRCRRRGCPRKEASASPAYPMAITTWQSIH